MKDSKMSIGWPSSIFRDSDKVEAMSYIYIALLFLVIHTGICWKYILNRQDIIDYNTPKKFTFEVVDSIDRRPDGWSYTEYVLRKGNFTYTTHNLTNFEEKQIKQGAKTLTMYVTLDELDETNDRSNPDEWFPIRGWGWYIPILLILPILTIICISTPAVSDGIRYNEGAQETFWGKAYVITIIAVILLSVANSIIPSIICCS